MAQCRPGCAVPLRWVRKRLPLALALAGSGMLLGAATVGAERPPFQVDQKGVGSVLLGGIGASYSARFGDAHRERLDGGLDRLVFENRDIAVIVRTTTGRIVSIVTWSSLHTTAARIGPCSRVTTLRRAYGNRLETVATGPGVIAFRLGRLVFAADPDGFVGSVMVAAGEGSPMLALEAPVCGRPSV